LKRLALAGVSSEETRRAYGRALTDFLLWFQAEPRGPFARAVVREYRAKLEADGLAPSSVNVRLSAIRKLAAESADAGFLSGEAAAGIAQVRGAAQRLTMVGNWLERDQAAALLQAPDPTTLRGKRDRAVLGLLIGCGLRRAELANLEVAGIQQREGRWVLIDLIGKGKRVRTVPLPAWGKRLIDEWLAAAGLTDGKVVRAIDKGGRLRGVGVTSKVIWSIVLRYACRIGIPNLAPHDLRRTCAKLCRAAGGDLEQIQLLLGHASIQTTENYLGTIQNLAEAINDRMGLDV
jgi:site-specific recombinase XerD